ncbi:MAG: DUF2892 domain-containing protein [Planctomycetaceae bacterium]|nr:DUF2892 domain-containing protein [Planctomycetaceae bacterium]
MKRSLAQQALIANGLIVFVSALLSLWPATRVTGQVLTLFMGASLIYSGWTGFCGWVPILSRAWWNRAE